MSSLKPLDSVNSGDIISNVVKKMGNGTVTMTKPKTLNVEEAASLLRVTPATLYNWLSENRHSILEVATKVGGRWLFFQDELVDWIKAKRRTDDA